MTIVKLPRTASAAMINKSLLKPPTRTVFRPILATVHSHTDLRDHPNIGLDAITCGPQLVALATLGQRDTITVQVVSLIVVGRVSPTFNGTNVKFLPSCSKHK